MNVEDLYDYIKKNGNSEFAKLSKDDLLHAKAGFELNKMSIELAHLCVQLYPDVKSMGIEKAIEVGLNRIASGNVTAGNAFLALDIMRLYEKVSDYTLAENNRRNGL